MPVPKSYDLYNDVLHALKRLGGSASIAELDEEVTRRLALPAEDVALAHDERQSELQYQLAWARTYLKKYGLIDNSSRGLWVLTSEGLNTESVDPNDVKNHADQQRAVRHPRYERTNPSASTRGSASLVPSEIAEVSLEQDWKEQLSAILLRLSPAAFERLCQRLLRESGFVQVRVTGRSGDGGIDGVGLVQLGGLLSFPIIFQCKRYQGSIGPGVIRDFRGAMTGRSDRGLVITTGTFSRDAKLEATRDGAPPVDLVDGEHLLEKLKELRLGVTVKMIEEVTVLPHWFSEL